MKKLITFLTSLTIFFVLVQPAFAHVVVKPNEVGVAQYQTFTVGVPNEKDVPIVSVRLLVPDGVGEITPNVKPGWTITTKPWGKGDNSEGIEIDWTGGSIPSGQRDDFFFSAQVPVSEMTLNWKAYQTYKDGSVVSWDQAPVVNMTDDQREAMEKTGKGPYSQTKIINDLAATSVPSSISPMSKTDTRSVTFSLVAIALSVCALTMQVRGKRNKI